MAFYYENSSVVSFAEASDVEDADQRIFNANESLTEDVVLIGVKRATERILSRMKSSSWWKKMNSSTTTATLPDVDADLIINRQQDFTDLCVFIALADYILPGSADFADPDSAERQKMEYYSTRAESLFVELLTLNDFYDFDSSGAIEDDEATTTIYTLKRVR